MVATATDITREHYQRPEVREIIAKFAMPGDGTWRALNGDFNRWYRYDDDGKARLLNVNGDYDYVTYLDRTLYQTLNVFDPSLWMISRPRSEITSDNPLGTPADTVAYTLGTDIDKGNDCDIDDPGTSQAVEAAAQFLVGYLKEHGIHESIWVLFSGGGIYVEIHHEICKPKSSTPEDRQQFFELLTDMYNRLIAHVSDEFFKAHPEYVGKVKYDALNNAKRVFKCILSIHKKKPYAVTPLNRDAIKIDLDRARVPLEDDMIAESRLWYSTYDPAEHDPLLKLLDSYKDTEDEKKRSERQFAEIWRSPSKVDIDHFPPCITHITNTENPDEGKTRFTAVLSAFLYQMGWDEEEAWNLVKDISDRNGLGNAEHIFDSCFGRISCPSCRKIQTDGAGYPHLGLEGLEVCKPDKGCKGCRWPGEYVLVPRPSVAEIKQKTNPDDLTIEDLCDVNIVNEGKEDERVDYTFSPEKACGTIMARYSLVSTPDKVIWVYQDGYYSPQGWENILKTVHVVAGDYFNKHMHAELDEKIYYLTRAGEDPFNKKPYLLCCKNKTVNLLTSDVLEHSPEDLTTDQIPVSYDPKATCPEIVKFIATLTPDEDDRRTLLDIIASGAYRQALYYIAFLIGHGSSGSTVFIEVIQAFYGAASTEAIPLNELIEKQFALSNLRNARYSFGQEIDEVKKAGTSRVKEISGGDWISADVKNKQDRARFRGWTKLIFKGNSMPRFTDNTWGFRRRFIEVVLPYKFVPVVDVKEPNQRQEDPDILEKITTPTELSGLLNLVIARLPEIIKSRRIYRKEGSFEAMKEQVDSVLTFFEKFCLYEQGSHTDKDTLKTRIPVKTLHANFEKWCGLIKGNLVEKRQFGKYIKKFCEDRSPIETTINDRTETTYVGLFFDQTSFDQEIKRLELILKNGCNPFRPDINRIKTGLEKSQKITNTGCTGLKEDIDTIWNAGVHDLHAMSLVEKDLSSISGISGFQDAMVKNASDFDPVTSGITSGEESNKENVDTDLPLMDKTEKTIRWTDDEPTIESELKQADEKRKEREEHFKTPEPAKKQRFDVIYPPNDPAQEYSAWACNIVKSPDRSGKGPKTCSHGCLYCYNKPGTEPGPVLKDDVLNRLKRDLPKLKKAIQPGQRLEFTFVGDLYDPDLPEGIARQCLMVCKEAGIPFQVLSKGGMKAVQDFDLYGPDDLFGTTLTGRDEWEPGAAPTEDRISALQEAHRRNIKTWVSFEPILDADRTLELIKRVHPFVDDIKIGKLNPKSHNPKEVKDLAEWIDWPKVRDDVIALCHSLGRVEGQSFTIKNDLKRAAKRIRWIDETAKSASTPSDLSIILTEGDSCENSIAN